MSPALKTPPEVGNRNRIRKPHTCLKPSATDKLTRRVQWNIKTWENRLKHSKMPIKRPLRISWVVHWWKNPPATQGTPYWFLIQADPICQGSTEPENHNHSSPPPKRQCSSTTEATTQRVCPPQLQRPCLLPRERNLGSKKHPALPKGVNWLNKYIQKNSPE